MRRFAQVVDVSDDAGFGGVDVLGLPGQVAVAARQALVVFVGRDQDHLVVRVGSATGRVGEALPIGSLGRNPTPPK